MTELRVGDAWELVLAQDLTRTQVVQYAGASGDFNPLHTDDRYAIEIGGYPSVFAHGMLTMAMSARLLTSRLGHHRMEAFGGRFTQQVWPGDRLVGKATVVAAHSEHVVVAIETTNQHGIVVFTGEATVMLGHPPEMPAADPLR